jgi:quercetin dioxygenase-like cupin family protein
MTSDMPMRTGGFRSGNDWVYRKGDSSEPLIMDMWMAPGTKFAPLHSHPEQREHFHVVTGIFDVKVNRDIHVLHSGDTITINPGERHTVGNRTDAAAIVYTELTPGLDTFSFFAELHRIGEECRNPVLQIIRIRALVSKYRREQRYSRLIAGIDLIIAKLEPIGRAVTVRRASLALVDGKATS